MPAERRRRLRRVALWALLAASLAGAVLTAAVLANPRLALDAWRGATLVAHGAETGTARVEGERLAWAAIGEGPPVVLVHGLRGELTVQMRLADALAERGYRVLAFDLPGHGKSAPPARPIDIERAGDLVLAAARDVSGVERPALVGHSLGGWIVGWQALAHPDRCGPVVLASAAGLPFELPEMHLLMTRTAADARESLPLLFAEPPAVVPTPILWFAVRRPHGTSLDLLRSATSGRFLLDDLLTAAEPPALVLYGGQDRLIPPAVGREMARQLPGHRYVEIENAGHMVVWETPDAVADAVHAFLSEVGYAE